jgi:hypothetical protein
MMRRPTVPDPFDVLFEHGGSTEPDPAFRSDVMERVRAALMAPHSTARSATTERIRRARDVDGRGDIGVELEDARSEAERGHRRRRRALRAAFGVAAAAAMVVAVVVGRDTTPRVSVDSSSASQPPTTATPERLAPEEISVTSDVIEYGDDLVVVVDRVAADDGLLYLLASQVHEKPRPFHLFEEAAVLVAFDEAGVERWRTELDGTPTDVVVIDGDPWVLQVADHTVSRFNSSDGRALGQVTLEAAELSHWMVGAFGAAWIAVRQEPTDASPDLVRIDPDLSITSIELPSHNGPLMGGCDSCRGAPVDGSTGDLWIPLGDDGVAVVGDTNQVTVIPRSVIGHEVRDVAVDGDVAYVASGDRVTSIVDRQVLATVATGEIEYLGRVDGVFGVLVAAGQFQTLSATDPMVVDHRLISPVSQTYGLAAIDGEAWVETVGLGNWALRRLQLAPV